MKVRITHIELYIKYFSLVLTNKLRINEVLHNELELELINQKSIIQLGVIS